MLDFANYAPFAVALVALTAILLVIIDDWRINAPVLALQYIGVFVLVAISWPLEMAVAKLVAGWMVSAVLGMAMVSLPRATPPPPPDSPEDETPPPSVEKQPPNYTGQLFRILGATLAGLAVLSSAPPVAEAIPGLSLTQAWGSLLLIGLGLWQLGFTVQPFRTSLGLLTAFSGFEILYAAVESSTLVAGLLAAVTLGLGLAGAYMIIAPHMVEEVEEEQA